VIEPHTSGIENVLRRDSEKTPKGEFITFFPVARKLAELAKTVGFEGWLINIEKSFPADIWHLDSLLEFLQELRSMGQFVVWYDALTTSNAIRPQNALTPLNLPFLQAAGNILLNYRWNPNTAESSLTLAKTSGICPESLFFGVDVWAQNRPRSFWHPRITWPSDTGGGTNTGYAVAKLAELGMSAGVFGPAWTYEHFVTPKHRQSAEQALWEGEELSLDVRCSCTPGWFEPRDPHRTLEYTRFPLINHAREFPAGSKTYFRTNFQQGFQKSKAGLYISSLGEQSMLPVPYQGGSLSWCLDNENSTLLVQKEARSRDTNRSAYIKLYSLALLVNRNTSLYARYRYEGPCTVHVCLTLDKSIISIPLLGKKGVEYRVQMPIQERLHDTTASCVKALGISVVDLTSYDNNSPLELFELKIHSPTS
jgi:hypothetical protein